MGKVRAISLRMRAPTAHLEVRRELDRATQSLALQQAHALNAVAFAPDSGRLTSRSLSTSDPRFANAHPNGAAANCTSCHQ